MQAPHEVLEATDTQHTLKYQKRKIIKILDFPSYSSAYAGEINHLELVSKNEIAIGARDGSLTIWNIKTGECIKTLQNNLSNGRDDEITGLLKLPNGNLASSSSNILRLWDPVKGQCLKTFQTKTGKGIIRCFLRLANGEFLLGVAIPSFFGDQLFFEIWDLKLEKCLRIFEDKDFGKHVLNTIAELSDGNIIYTSVGHSGKLKIFDIKLGKVLKEIRFIDDSSFNIMALKALPNNRVAISVHNSYWLGDFIFDINTMKSLFLQSSPHYPTHFYHLMSDGKLMSCHINQVKIWDYNSIISKAKLITYPLKKDVLYELQDKLCDEVTKQNLSTHDFDISVNDFVHLSHKITIIPISDRKLIYTLNKNQFGYADTIALLKMPSGRDKNAERYKTVIETFQSILDGSIPFSIEKLSEMYNNANDLFLFRFPYTLANMYRKININDKDKIDDLTVQALKDFAQNNIKGPELYAIFVKVILKSAVAKKIIDPLQKATIAKIADNTETFSDERYQKLVAKVNKIANDVEVLKENVKTLANQINQLKIALQKKAKRDMIFGIARVALAFIGSQAIDLLSGIADFSDVTEVASVMFDIPVESIEKALISNQKIILNTLAGKALKLAGFNPDDFIHVWSKTAVVLLSSQDAVVEPAVAQTQTCSSLTLLSQTSSAPTLFPLKPSPKQIAHNPSVTQAPLPAGISSSSNTAVKPSQQNSTATILTSNSSPSLFSTLNTSGGSENFNQWLQITKQHGHFSLVVDNKSLKISFESQNISQKEIEKTLEELNDYLDKLSDIQKIVIEDRDIQDKSLIIITKATLYAKKLKALLEDQYHLTLLCPISQPSLNK